MLQVGDRTLRSSRYVSILAGSGTQVNNKHQHLGPAYLFGGWRRYSDEQATTLDGSNETRGTVGTKDDSHV